jgi:hypothetical protein
MTIYLDDIATGHEVVTARRTITEAHILWFCGLSAISTRCLGVGLLVPDVPAYRVADRAFLARLDANYLVTGDAGRPGAPFDRPSLILTDRQDSTVGYRGAWGLVEELARHLLRAGHRGPPPGPHRSPGAVPGTRG